MLADEDGRTNRPAPLLGAADRSPPVTSRLLLLQVQVQLQVLVGAAAAGWWRAADRLGKTHLIF
jgi:hypothetical protein